MPSGLCLCLLASSIFFPCFLQFGLILRQTLVSWQTWSLMAPGWHLTSLATPMESKYPFPSDSIQSPGTDAYLSSMGHRTNSDPITGQGIMLWLASPKHGLIPKATGGWSWFLKENQSTGIMDVIQAKLTCIHPHWHQTFGLPWCWGPGRVSSSEPTVNTLFWKDPWLPPPEAHAEWGNERKEQGKTSHPSPLGLLVPSFWLSFS